jgi:hypothetical protein
MLLEDQVYCVIVLETRNVEACLELAVGERVDRPFPINPLCHKSRQVTGALKADH